MKTPRKARFYHLVPQTLYELTKVYARCNRKAPTPAEEILWHHLRNRKLDGFKFRRQHPVGTYVVDFVCFDRKLVIELDGEIHLEGYHPRRDERRTRDLVKMGYRLVRFTNQQVFEQLSEVLHQIRKALRDNGQQENASERK